MSQISQFLETIKQSPFKESVRSYKEAQDLSTWAPTCSRADLESGNNLLAVPMHSRRKGLKQHQVFVAYLSIRSASKTFLAGVA